MRSVVVARYVPWPPNSGDKQRTLAVVRALQQQGDVTVCAFAGPDEDVDGLRAQGVEVRGVRQRRTPLRLLEGVFRGRSLTAARFWDPKLEEQVQAAMAEGPCEVLVLEHVQSTMYAPKWVAGTRVVNMHNIESALADRVGREHHGIKRWIWLVEARLLRRVERRIRGDDVVAVVSEADRDTLLGVTSHPDVLVAPNGWESAEVLPSTTDPVVSFVALLSWSPNVAAAQWFTREVWPLVLASVPDARLQLVGRNPSASVLALAADGVIVTGTVPDIEPWYRGSLVCLAPLLAGGGSRLKILEALAYGRPVVATQVGVEGLEDLVGRGVVVADDPSGMATLIVDLLQDPEATAALGRSGAQAVEAGHSWRSTLGPMMNSIERSARA